MAFQWVNGRLELTKNKIAFRNFASKGTVAFLMITQVWGFVFLVSLSLRNSEQTVEAPAYSYGPLHLKIMY